MPDDLSTAADDADQRDVIAFLSDPRSHGCEGRVERIETHGNMVFLSGRDAWKIKRAVRFAYMDFSTLAKRRAGCLREVEINSRFAPEIYLGCVPITRRVDGGLEFAGDGEVVEWAVHMRRFEQSDLLSSIASAGGLTAGLAKSVADAVWDSHQKADRVSCATGASRMAQLLETVRKALATSGAFDAREIGGFARDAKARLERASSILDERACGGFVRRCHGDLHLANVVVRHGRPLLYDAIEFDEEIATTDTLYDLAFLVMDLDWRGHRRAANLVLSHYCWRSQQELDLRGLAALPLFLGLRAAVRGMVSADRAAQEQGAAAAADRQTAQGYVRAANGYVQSVPAQLIVVGGFSGSGKSTIGAGLAPLVGAAPGALHLRSDLERKALFGFGEFDRLPAEAYTKEAGEMVYGRLRERARCVLAAGHSVVVDAVFADPLERSSIEAVAAALGVACRGVWLSADPAVLLARVTARRQDASDATPDVVQTQLCLDIGTLSPTWRVVDAGGSIEATWQMAAQALGLHGAKRGAKPTGTAP